MFGLILGILAVTAGIIGIKYSVAAIVIGVTSILAFFGIKRE